MLTKGSIIVFDDYFDGFAGFAVDEFLKTMMLNDISIIDIR